MRRLLKPLFILLLTLLMQSATAELVVVSGAKSGIDHLSRQDVVFLFMGRLRQLPTGVQALPLDLAVDSPERADFYRLLVNKEPAEIKAYWSRLVFSGGTRPPQVVDSREDLIRLLGSNPGAIAYMERSRIDPRVRVLFDFSAQP